jgi:hypothetical protein
LIENHYFNSNVSVAPQSNLQRGDCKWVGNVRSGAR